MCVSVVSCRCSQCRLLALLLLFAFLLLIPTTTQAEELQGSNVDQRVVIALAVDQAKLQRWIRGTSGSSTSPLRL